jgi:HlyD family secretion protein
MVKLIAAILGLVAALCGACRPSTSKTQEGGPVLIIHAKPQTELLERPATIESLGLRVIRAPGFQGDRILTWIAPEGSFVKKGDVVAIFDPAPVQALLDLKNGALTDSSHNAETLRLDWAMRLDSAGIRREQLGQKLTTANLQNEASKFLPEIPRSTARTQLDLAAGEFKGATQKENLLGDFSKRQIADASTKENAAGRELTKIKKVLTDVEIKAPEDGFVLHMQITKGGAPPRKIQHGDNLEKLQPFLQIHRIDGNVLRIPMSERDLAKISPGQKMTFHVRMDSATIFNAKISEIPAFAYTAPGGTSLFPVDADIPPQHGIEILRPGMTAYATIPVAKHPVSFMVPIDFVFSPRDGINAVRVMAENGTWSNIALPADCSRSGNYVFLPPQFTGSRKDGTAMIGIPPAGSKPSNFSAVARRSEK